MWSLDQARRQPRTASRPHNRTTHRLARQSAQMTSPTAHPPPMDGLSTVISVSRHRPGNGLLWAAAEALDRSARQPYARPVPDTSAARRLRAVSQQLAQAGRLSGHGDRQAAWRLMNSLARLSDSVAELRRAQQRLHQAEDTLRASVVLREHAAAGEAAASSCSKVTDILPGPTPYLRCPSKQGKVTPPRNPTSCHRAHAFGQIPAGREIIPDRRFSLTGRVTDTRFSGSVVTR